MIMFDGERLYPEQPPGMIARSEESFIAIDNTTITENFSGGATKFDNILNKTVLYGARCGGIAIQLAYRSFAFTIS